MNAAPSVTKEPTGTQTVERALALIQLFTHGRPELRVSDLVRLSGLGQSTVSRLLTTLESQGYVERNAQTGLYSLGRGLVTLAGVVLNQSPVHREARQIAQELACRLGLGANVAIREDSRLFYLLNFEGPLAPRASTLVGQHVPLHATALGKALLCELPDEELERLVDERPARYTPHTLTTRAALSAALTRVREQGYATEVEELAFGRACVAAPVRDRSSAVVAALSVSGPLSAMDLPAREKILAGHAVEAADLISVGLGYVAAADPVPSPR